MQINNINNASKNVVFNAKLQMEGAVKDLPKELITKFENSVKKIGNDSDIVAIKFGTKYQRAYDDYENGVLRKIYSYFRDNDIASYVNGKIRQKRITTSANNFNNSSEMGNLEIGILDYLKTLIKLTSN